MPSTTSLLTILSLALTTFARTDFSGCTSSKTVAYGGASILWYVPGTGEICEALDCGGGRAPPKTTVPGCAAYVGTATYSPSFIALATASAESSYATSIGSWTSVASALSSTKTITATAGGKGSSTVSSVAVEASTTEKATLSSVVVAAGTGGLSIDTSVISSNGTALSTSATPIAASGSSSSSATGAAGVVRLGRDAMVMVAGAVVGVALL